MRGTENLLARMDELNQDARSEILTILFADMRGFTQLCNSLNSPALVQEHLSEFISAMSSAVIEHSGIVNKFLGDGLMALFQETDSCRHAVKCAFSMVESFSQIKNEWNQKSNQQLDFLDLGVGITTDEVILGGMGNSQVRDYTAIGNPVNLAAAFESEARNGKRILCDHATFNNSSDIIAESQQLDDFKLTKPGQHVAISYKNYHLKSLKNDRSPRTLAKGESPRVFVSHSHADKDYVEDLIQRLSERGIDSWYSVTDIKKGTQWTTAIRKAVSNCDWMIVIVSKNAAKSRWVRKEIDIAAAVPQLVERILPIVLDETKPESVNSYMAHLQAFYSSTSSDIPNDVAKTIKSPSSPK